MPFDRIFLDELSARNDIVEIVSQYVQLKKSGANYFGLCPFHNEKTGSFSVSPDKQIFHCFGCGAGGGATESVCMRSAGTPDAIIMTHSGGRKTEPHSSILSTEVCPEGR